jgi:isopenicillin N synthase-like dioxygenase
MQHLIPLARPERSGAPQAFGVARAPEYARAVDLRQAAHAAGEAGNAQDAGMPHTTIPTIDLEPLLGGTEAGRASVADRVLDVYANVGFAYLLNHGIADELIEGLFAASAQFHALPRERKLELEINRFHRGFIPINTSTDTTTRLATVTRPQQSESFMVMHELAPDDPDVLAGAFLAGPNQWPGSLPGFEPAVRAYETAAAGLARRLVPAIAVALGLRPEALDHHFARPTTFLRLLTYPEQPASSPDDLYGSSPHTDYGFITLLLQDDAGGLQVRATDGTWLDAPPRAGAIVMNSGDMLHRMSNGRLLSTPHRVINRSGRVRYSCPYFFDPDLRSVIEPCASWVGADEPPRYEPLVYGDFLADQLRANHDQHARRG